MLVAADQKIEAEKQERLRLEQQNKKEKEDEAALRKQEKEAEEAKQEAAREAFQTKLNEILAKKEEENKTLLEKLESERGKQEARERDQRELDRAKLESKNAVSNKMYKVMGLLKKVVEPCPNKADELALYFMNLEHAFVTYKVEEEIQLPVLIALLSKKLKLIHAKINHDEFNTYEKLKTKLLMEHYVSAEELFKLFKGASKYQTETHATFFQRVSSMFDFYLRSRKVNTYEKLVDLVLCDKLKENMEKEVKDKLVIEALKLCRRR